MILFRFGTALSRSCFITRKKNPSDTCCCVNKANVDSKKKFTKVKSSLLYFFFPSGVSHAIVPHDLIHGSLAIGHYSLVFPIATN